MFLGTESPCGDGLVTSSATMWDGLVTSSATMGNGLVTSSATMWRGRVAGFVQISYGGKLGRADRAFHGVVERLLAGVVGDHGHEDGDGVLVTGVD